MILDADLFGQSKDEQAIALLRELEPPEGYYMAFSGGKDSTVLYDLAVQAGVKFDAHYGVTTVDPPELLRHIRRHYPLVKWEHHNGLTMWKLIVERRMPPTRMVRYCCRELKEHGGAGRVVLTGVRWAESARRAERRQVEICNKDASKTYVHPIINWSDAEVWEYIRRRELPYCSLYDEGFKRIGCVMCPMTNPSVMRMEAARWPQIARAYRRACRKSLNKAIDDGLVRTEWRYDTDDMYEWYVGDTVRGPSSDTERMALE